MQKIKFAIIGLGNIGLRHAHHILQNGNAELIATCDIRNEAKLGHLPHFNHINDLLKHTDFDVLNVCSPNYLHEEHSIAALESNRHVVCEKPMAICADSCTRMIDAAEKHGKKIYVVKQNRYNPPVVQMKQLLEQGTLGKVALISVNCFWNRNEAYYKGSDWRGRKLKDGGCLFTQFSHFVDILYYLFGKCTADFSRMNNLMHPYTEIEDNGTCILHTASGSIVNFNFSTCSHQKNMEGSITVIAEKGTVKIGGQYLNTIEYQNIHNTTLPEINISAKANDYGSYSGSMSNHDLVIENVIENLNGKADIKTNAYEGRDVVDMIEQMYAAQLPQ